MRGIKSAFQFDSYKVDTLKLDMSNQVRNIAAADMLPHENWQFKIQFRPPQFFSEDNIYVGGLDFDIRLVDDPEAEEPTEILAINTGIAGIFSLVGELPKETEEKLVKFQVPTILMPYLRATITSVLSAAGYGSVILPLINVARLAEEQSDQLEIIRK